MDREELRRKKIEERDRKLEKLYFQYPEIKNIENQISRLSLARIKNLFSKNNPKNIEIEKRVEELIRQKEEVLAENGIDISIYEPDWNCKKCKDRGYIEPGVLCECLKAEKLNKMIENSGLSGEQLEKSFDNFNTKYYLDPEGMKIKVQKSIQFVNNIINNENQNSLYFFGDVGTGKTHLSSAIANMAMEYGASVIYKRVDDLLELIREIKFDEKNKGKLEALKGVDLLIIDDLGAEKTTAFVQNQLRILIEERNNLNKNTVINGNLNLDELQDYYGQRVADRVIERYDIFEFKTEESIRIQLRRESKK